MQDATGGPSAETVIRTGGWHPRYARVLLIEHDGDYALALIDGNGDGAELEVEYWERGPDGDWHAGSSSGFGPLDTMSAAESWNAGEFVAAVGRADPAAEMRIGYGGSGYTRRANESGVWGFVHAADSPHPDDLPAVAAVEPGSP